MASARFVFDVFFGPPCGDVVPRTPQPTFFQRIHAPTLGATLGVWCMTAATIAFFSVQGDSLFLHAVLIALFVALTTPVTTIFLMRAALFRERQKGGGVP